MTIEERRVIADALLKLTPLAVSFVVNEKTGARGNDPVMVPMSTLKDAAEAMRELKIMVYGQGEVA